MTGQAGLLSRAISPRVTACPNAEAETEAPSAGWPSNAVISSPFFFGTATGPAGISAFRAVLSFDMALKPRCAGALFAGIRVMATGTSGISKSLSP